MYNTLVIWMINVHGYPSLVITKYDVMYQHCMMWKQWKGCHQKHTAFNDCKQLAVSRHYLQQRIPYRV